MHLSEQQGSWTGPASRSSVQLWSYNYAPEPTGIAPVSTMLARLLSERGWRVSVIAAHPHYPEPRWGNRLRPYLETRDGIRVLRLPLWVGRDSASRRIAQEMTYSSALAAAIPILGRMPMARPDVMVVASPSFPALLPAMISARIRRTPWVLWLHDLLPDGAVSSGLLGEDGTVLRASRWLERTAYRSTDSIAVLSKPFLDNLIEDKGVPPEKLSLIYDPASRGIPTDLGGSREPRERSVRILSMGNIGYTQGLAPLVAAFERSPSIAELDARLVITGNGVAASDVQREIRSSRVEMPGLVSDEQLEGELRSADLALVSQRYDGTEFNLPSKLMNFMSYGLPVVAAVNPAGEVARIVKAADAGWVIDSSDADAFPRLIADVATDFKGRTERSFNARRYAEEHFSPRSFGESFDRLLKGVLSARR